MILLCYALLIYIISSLAVYYTSSADICDTYILIFIFLSFVYWLLTYYIIIYDIDIFLERIDIRLLKLKRNLKLIILVVGDYILEVSLLVSIALGIGYIINGGGSGPESFASLIIVSMYSGSIVNSELMELFKKSSAYFINHKGLDLSKDEVLTPRDSYDTLISNVKTYYVLRSYINNTKLQEILTDLDMNILGTEMPEVCTSINEINKWGNGYNVAIFKMYINLSYKQAKVTLKLSGILDSEGMVLDNLIRKILFSHYNFINEVIVINMSENYPDIYSMLEMYNLALRSKLSEITRSPFNFIAEGGKALYTLYAYNASNAGINDTELTEIENTTIVKIILYIALPFRFNIDKLLSDEVPPFQYPFIHKDIYMPYEHNKEHVSNYFSNILDKYTKLLKQHINSTNSIRARPCTILGTELDINSIYFKQQIFCNMRFKNETLHREVYHI